MCFDGQELVGRGSFSLSVEENQIDPVDIIRHGSFFSALIVDIVVAGFKMVWPLTTSLHEVLELVT